MNEYVKFQNAISGMETELNRIQFGRYDTCIVKCTRLPGTEEWTYAIQEYGEGTTDRMDKGCSYDGLMERLKKREQPASENVAHILCLLGITKRTGKEVRCLFYKITPGIDFHIQKNGQPEFPIIRKNLTDMEYKRVKATGLAFYSRGMIFPIMKEAISSIGSFFDCSAIFKHLDKVPLGAALLLASKAAEMNRIQMICRQCTKTVHPVYGVAGNRYVHIPLKEFYKELFARMTDRIYDVEQWKVNDMVTEVSLKFHDCEDAGILIRASDASGEAFTVQSFIRGLPCRIPIHKNRESHTPKFMKGGYERLMDGIMLSIEAFVRTKNALKSQVCIYSPDMVDEIFLSIGKKRTEDVNIPYKEGEAYPAWELFSGLVSATYYELPKKQADSLTDAYAKLFQRIQSEAYQSSLFRKIG